MGTYTSLSVTLPKDNCPMGFTPKPLPTSFNPTAEIHVHSRDVTTWAKQKLEEKNSNREGKEMVFLKPEPLQNSQDFRVGTYTYSISCIYLCTHFCSSVNLNSG